VSSANACLQAHERFTALPVASQPCAAVATPGRPPWLHLVLNSGLQVAFYGGQTGDATARPAPVRRIMRAGPKSQNAVVVLVA
jgi:hypothetical protein